MTVETQDRPTSPERLRAGLATVVAIPVTPFREDGSVDWDTHAALIRRLMEHGVEVVNPNGNTGEFASRSTRR